MEANIRNLVLEIGWFGVVWGTVVAFLQVYIVRLGASSLLVGAITYGPALVGILWQMPAARLVTRTGGRMAWVVGSGFFFRLQFLLVALLPFFFSQGRAEITALVWVLGAVASSISNVVFLSMMADAVPTGRMTQVVGWRIAGFGLANTIVTLLGGQFLKFLPFPLNFQVLFLIGYAGAMISWGYVRRIHVPDPPADRSQHPAFWRDLSRMLRYPRFSRFLLSVGVLQLALGMIAPLLPLYWVRSLSASDAQVSVVMTVTSGALVIGSLLMRRLVSRIGRTRALAAGRAGLRVLPAADLSHAIGVVAGAVGRAGRPVQRGLHRHPVRQPGFCHSDGRSHQLYGSLQRGREHRPVRRADPGGSAGARRGRGRARSAGGCRRLFGRRSAAGAAERNVSPNQRGYSNARPPASEVSPEPSRAIRPGACP